MPFCFMQVDLRGWLSQHGPWSWLYRCALQLGLVDQLLEQLLLSVALVKQEVEQQCFRVGMVAFQSLLLFVKPVQLGLVDQLLEQLLEQLLLWVALVEQEVEQQRVS
jgi:hypothetical protein